jgi:hypothetical protein
MDGKVLYARFFKLSTGKEPGRDWLKAQTKEAKKVIGEDINTIERTWPMTNDAIGSGFESFLEEEGIREEVESGAVKKIIALQMQNQLKYRRFDKIRTGRKA